ncbi:MAG: acyl-CoA dehydrogenase family protein, partial [Deltaproteobacteria bacterium]
MPSYFTEQHEMFRKTVRTFCEKELAPHMDQWEEDELFPNWVFKRAGELGILGAHYPEEQGGGGGDFWFSVAKAEELPRCKSAGVPMALLVQSDMATPCIGDLGTKEQIEEFLMP